jgi:hydrogenase-4 component F
MDTMAFALIMIPLIAAAIALAVPSNRLRPWVVLAGAVCHSVLTLAVVSGSLPVDDAGWMRIDGQSRYFLSFISLYFSILALYLPAYLASNGHRSNRVLCACLLASLSSMTAVIVAHHLGLMWIAIEATTLATAPCVYFERNARALEATWKYLVICSVGIALALLGTFFLAYASLHSGIHSLLFEDLMAHATELSAPWLHIAFVFALVGYGTKMGLAPMHTWLPDAHAESPAVVSALLSGALLNCAFLGILRFYLIIVAAGQAWSIQPLLIFIGRLSMSVAAVSMCRQRDIKRLVAYSSVEHMGMLAFGLGVGGIGVAASMLHVIHNGLCKGVLFLAAGNIYRAFGTRSTDEMSGVLRRVPWSGGLFVAGFFAITGAPGFGPFVSEIMMLGGAFSAGKIVPGCLFIMLLFVVFLGMGRTVLGFALGPAPDSNSSPRSSPPRRERIGETLPIVIALALVILLGFYTPPFLIDWIEQAVALPAIPSGLDGF